MLFFDIIYKIFSYFFVGFFDFLLFCHFPYIIECHILRAHFMQEIAVGVETGDLLDEGSAVASGSIVWDTLETLMLVVLHSLY